MFDCTVLQIMLQIFTGNTLTTLADRRNYRDKIIYDRELVVFASQVRGLF